MKLFNYFLILTLSFLIYNCDSTEPTPPNVNPPGYQEDIPWPSLADSPWPMYQHDPQNTGRSKYSGAQNGILNSTIDFENPFGILIDSDSSFLCSSEALVNGGISRFSNSGNLDWNIQSISSQTIPLINNEGIIYFATINSLSAPSSEGNILWEYKSNVMFPIIGMNIGIDGTVYLINQNSEIIGFDKDGNLIFNFYDADISWSSRNSIVFSPDGNTIYTTGISSSVIAVDIKSKQIKWKFGKPIDGRQLTTPLIDSNGNIYINAIDENNNGGKATMFALNPDGSILWAVNDIEIVIPFQPTIDKNGNLYFGDNSLYSVNYKGEINWMIALDGNIGENLICDSENIIYTAITNDNLELLAVDDKGNIKWNLNEPVYGSVNPFLIGSDKLIVPTSKGNSVYIIE